MESAAISEIETKILLEAIYLRYGYDFRHYAPESIYRRIQSVLERKSLPTISDLQKEILHKPQAFESFVALLTVNTTEMFRDPAFFSALREEVFPFLQTYPSLKIWHAGCSTGEEVYSLAILLQEAGLYERSLIYATDISAAVLEKAKQGIYPLEYFREASENYKKAGGKGALSDYAHASYDSVTMDATLKRNLVFAQHNLATDASFGEMHLILCRNVMIYFGRNLQNRVLNLMGESLKAKGFLCLGRQETLYFTECERDYEQVGEERIFRKSGKVLAS